MSISFSLTLSTISAALLFFEGDFSRIGSSIDRVVFEFWIVKFLDAEL